VQADRNAPVYGSGEIEVVADPETVWGVVADISGVTLRGPVRPGTTSSWQSGPGTITSTFQVVDEPTELAWTGRTMGIRPSPSTGCAPAASIPSTPSPRPRSPGGGLLARRLRKRFTTTLKTAIDSGLTGSRPRPNGGSAHEPGR
jgi:hypothetical protein